MPKTFDQTQALIRTLLAIADGGSPHEAERELARSRAEKLMLRHSIDEASVRMTREEAHEPVRTDTEIVGSWVLDRLALRSAVYGAFGCRSLRVRRGGATEHVAFGFASDMSMAAVLADSLEPQMLAEMYAHGGTASDKRAFAAGFTIVVADRLTAFYAEVLTEAEAEGTSSALVVAARDARVDSALAQAFPQVRTSRRRLSGAGWSAGAAAGARADIAVSGRKVDPSTTRALGA
ncbi:DUF2786 domain-containing protein [Cellulomonas rhizosphaerae]|uniref:DUF2786 domain-containing protein n=1 Tax=Cellulomonas rhizosphaerae TaxID=2293719 RepID=A0A413RH21_9CELL|nr:DUF2786 domain-containing protein [Cellulomonas rhizosphaerae]RHA37076.1 DUF2786 domain-containing protein [Cellulomonas rhizosphaerae]